MRKYFVFAIGMGLLHGHGALAAPIDVPVTPAATLAFIRHRELLWLAEQLWPCLVAILVLFTGFGARLRAGCLRAAGGRYYPGLLLFACAYLGVAALAVAPLKFYTGVLDLQAWGKPAPAPAAWWTGEAIGLAVKLVMTALFVWVPYALIVRQPRRWWLYSAAALVPAAFFVIVAWPVWVAPLTSHYAPLQDQALFAKIREMEARCGVPPIPVFIGGHEDTVVGLGPTNRIVLNQDIFRNETPDQIEFTVGHEMKHYLAGDNWKALAIVTGLLFAGFFLVDLIGRFLIDRHAGKLGFGALSDPASFPMAILILSLGWLLVLPAFNAFARHIEHEADRFSLELTHRHEAMGTMFAGFSTHWGQEVEWDTFQMIFHATHPSNGDRIRFAAAYRPGMEGRALTETMCHHSVEKK